MKIAIVGGGLSGASALKVLIDHPNYNKIEIIHVFEPRSELGVGLPYSFDDESVMLNVSPNVLSVVKDKPLDFTLWLHNNFKEPTNFENLVSRIRYGQYLKERFKPYFNNEKVLHIKEEVLDLKVLNKDQSKEYLYQLKTCKGWQNEIYDAIFLAIGHPEYSDYYNLSNKINYISNPYPMIDKLSTLPKDKKIGIIGSGATGIDLMRYFFTNYNLKKPLTFYVRNNSFNFVDIPYNKKSFKFSFSKNWIEKNTNKSTGTIPFKLMLKTFIDDLKSEGVDVSKVYSQYKDGDLKTIRKAVISQDQDLALVHSYNSKLVAFLPHLYNLLSGQDKNYYLKNYHDKLLFFKSRVPYYTFVWLFDLLDNKKLRVVKDLEAVEVLKDNTFLVRANKDEKVDVLINATGFDSRLEKAAQGSKLINNLLHKNIIVPHMDGHFVLIDWPIAKVINQKYGVMDNLFFFGLLVGGSQHENNDASLTIELATTVATWFMDQR